MEISRRAFGSWLAKAALAIPFLRGVVKAGPPQASPVVPFGQVPLSPKRYGTATAYSRHLVVLSSIGVEGLVGEDLREILEREFDRAVLK